MHVAVIGGGFGGVTAALALRKNSVPCSLFERAPAPRELPAGLILWHPALLVLATLGVYPDLARLGLPLTASVISSRAGRVLGRYPHPIPPDSPTPSLPAGLILPRDAALDALHAHLPPGLARFNSPLLDLHLDAASVTARFPDRLLISPDVLVGADGLHSTVRAAILPPAPPRYRGYTCWRSITTDAFPALVPGELHEFWGTGARFGFAVLPSSRAAWWATLNTPAGGVDDNATTALGQAFADWPAPVPLLLRATRARDVHRLDVFDRPPAPYWSRHRVTLLGDAAHPTTPSLAHGAGLAIQDAAALAHHLAQAHTGAVTPEAALLAYERARAAPTARLSRRSSVASFLTQLENPLLVSLRDSAASFLPSSLLSSGLGVPDHSDSPPA